MKRLTSVLLTMLLLANIPALAQATRGSLTGLVSDINKAAIAGATVTLKNISTGEELRTSTNSQGVFVFPSLLPGTYSATVEASGFKRTEVTEIVIEVSQQAKVDITLEVGTVNEQVTVTSEAQEVINTTSPVLSKTINAKQVQDLPLLSRNPIDLARLQPGLAVSGTDVRNASVQGLRGNATNVTQDGINAMDNFVKGSSFFAISAPSLNATSEFSITVGTVGSDAGRGVAQVQIVTPSGSNEFHGGVFYQHRNDALNANSFFNNATGTPRPFLRQHFFGVQASGPVWIPKIYDGRNKSLWFFSYEGFREPFSVTRNRTVLTPEARRGIYRYTGANGQLTTVNLLSLGNFHALNPQTTTILNSMPLPNNTLLGDGLNTAGFRFNVPGSDPSDRYNARFDQELFNSQKWGSHKLEAVFHRGEFLLTPDTFNGIESPFPGLSANAFQASTRTLWAAAIHSTFGAYVTNEVRFGHQEAPVGFLRETFPDRPLITFGSVTTVDNTFLSQGRNTKLNQFIDNLSMVKGPHTFRMGADAQVVFAFSFNDAGIVQTINIGSNSANPDGLSTANFPNLPAGQAGTDIFNRARAIYRDLTGMLGSTTRTFNVTSPTSGFVPNATRGRRFKYNDVSFYFQDAWRIRRNFTFNYGTRWEYLGVPSLPDGLGLQVTNFEDIYGISGPGNIFKPGVMTGRQTATLDFVSGKTSLSLYQKDWNNFAPFIGFAWSPNFNSGPLHWIFGDEGRSSMRGGFSISYLRDGFTVISNALGTGTTNPGLIQTAANTVPTGVLGSGDVSLNTPAFKVPITAAENFAANPNNGLWAIDPNLVTPYVQQWSFGIEREITANTALEVRYAGNHAVKIFRAVDYNEGNIFENGFLQEFLNAQKNLAIFRAANPNCGQAGQPACRFDNRGLPGQVNLPIFTALFQGVSLGNGFASTTFIPNLDQNNIGAMVTTLAFSPTYRVGRANLPANFFVTNPFANFARVLGNFSYSNYHSLQVEIRRRFSQGLQFQANYTLSRTLNDGTTIVNNQSTLESYRTLRNLRLDYQNSDQDQRHRFVANTVYDLPFGTGRRFLSSGWGPIRKAIEGWTLGAIVTYQTGTPFYITSGRSTFNNFNAGNAPAQLVGMTFDEFKKNIGVFKTGVGVFYINPSLLNIVTDPKTGQLISSRIKEGIFAAPAPGTFGNFPLNSLYGPNFTQTDLSIVKRTYFSEHGNVEFRVIAFNIFNQTNFTIGNVTFDAANFLRITGQQGQVRQFSFNVAVNW
ncbi:MAG TPA: carboxypeptidase-like regulatory domain-containing protein [Blastocatellia bacterium]|nr:carboxypeptidase-like regulatory domain-containing protein [Blastocatellia bacterium]